MKEAEGDLKGEGQGQGQGDGQGQGQGQGDKNGAGGLDDQGRTGKGRAVEAQGRALEALRQGAQGLQQQAQGNGEGNGQGNGRGYKATSRRPGMGGPGRDPLGREAGNRGGALEGSLNGGPDVAERARRVLEELRRRLADPNRPEEERDYFERLLKRN